MRKGFTLIELMIVVAIIGILAAVSIPNFIYARRRALVGQCESNLRALGDAVILFFADKGHYPDPGMAGFATFQNDLINGGYLKTDAAFYCPLGSQYCYEHFVDVDGEPSFRIECPHTLNPITGGCASTPPIHMGFGGPKSQLDTHRIEFHKGMYSIIK